MTDSTQPAPAAPAATTSRKPRLLWANAYCLLDTSSGASMAVREMLRQLVAQGIEVHILGATVFDHERGAVRFLPHREKMQADVGKSVRVEDAPLLHHLLVTASTQRPKMTSLEEGIWFSLYESLLDKVKPDVVYYYGGQTLDLLIAAEARARGVPAVAYLANGNFHGTRWCRDVDLLLTDSHATADKYAPVLGFRPLPVGAFIDPRPVLASEQHRQRILFINPVLAKGVGIVIQLALLLEKRRPDIVFEVVESRGGWQEQLRAVSASLGEPRETLDNVVVTANTDDMRPVYGRARLLLAPSLWWESAGRVVAEAMLNGIPAIVTDRGGMPEMIQDAGIKLRLPPECHEPPYTKLPQAALLEPVVERILQWYDDAALYEEYVGRARRVGQTRHGLATSTQRLLAALRPLFEQRAGDRDVATRLDSVALQLGIGRLPEAPPTPSPMAAGKLPLVLVCGPWSAGTSAVAGLLAKLGLAAPGPYWYIEDSRAPCTYEMAGFRQVLRSLTSEQNLQRLASSPEMSRALADFRDGLLSSALAKHNGGSAKPVPAMLKHALAALLLPELSEVFELRIVFVLRPLEDIERTRLRRNWPANYGARGAALLYDKMFSFMVDSTVPFMTVRYKDLLAQPDAVVDSLIPFLGIAVDDRARHLALASIRHDSPAAIEHKVARQ